MASSVRPEAPGSSDARRGAMPVGMCAMGRLLRQPQAGQVNESEMTGPTSSTLFRKMPATFICLRLSSLPACACACACMVQAGTCCCLR